MFAGVYWSVQEEWVSPFALCTLSLLLGALGLGVSSLTWGGPGERQEWRGKKEGGRRGKEGGRKEEGVTIEGDTRESKNDVLSTGVLSDYIKPAVIFISFLCAVSPILRTLTEAISTDTIWAMTVGGSNYTILY